MPITILAVTSIAEKFSFGQAAPGVITPGTPAAETKQLKLLDEK